MEFTQTAGQNHSAATREQKLKDLAAAYDSFTELKSNLEEGTKVCWLHAVGCKIFWKYLISLINLIRVAS